MRPNIRQAADKSGGEGGQLMGRTSNHRETPQSLKLMVHADVNLRNDIRDMAPVGNSAGYDASNSSFQGTQNGLHAW